MAWWADKATEVQNHADNKRSKEFYAGLKSIFGPVQCTTAPIRNRACSSLTKRTSWSNGPFTSVPCSTGPQKWPMKHWSPFSSAPWSQNLMPHLTQQRLMQESNSCKQARLRDQMEYQPRCSKPVVKPLSLTLPGCSKCSGSMASSHRTSGMPTSSTCTKTRVIAHPATTTAGSASSALQARYWPVSCWTGSPSTYWMMLCLRASVASESRGARWIWSLLSGSSRKNVSSSTKTSTCSSSISPKHSTLWTELHSGRYSASLDAHLEFVQIIRSFHDGMFCRVIENGDASDPFPVSNGVKQGCVLAPTLFSLLFAQMLSAALSQTEAGVKIHYRTDGDFFNLRRLKSYTKVTRAIVQDFLFADDCTLAAHSEADLQELADCFATAATSFGHQESEHQENWSVETARPKHCSAPTQHHHGWKCAEKCRHLQIPRQLHKLCSQPCIDDEVLCRISRASQAFGRLHTRVWHERGISIKTKLSVYRAVVLPSLLYGCETWTCYRRHTKKLDQFHLRCLRKVLRVSWKEHVPNQEILRSAELTGIEAMLNQAQLRWSGHVTRMDDSRLPKQLFHAELSTGKRHNGGRGSGTKTCWNQPSRPATSQLTSGKPWPRTGRPGGQLHARAQSTLREADYRAWMIRDRQGRTECQTLALLYLVSSAARSALLLLGSKLICANTSTDASSSYSKDYYYYYYFSLCLTPKKSSGLLCIVFISTKGVNWWDSTRSCALNNMDVSLETNVLFVVNINLQSQIQTCFMNIN